MAGAGETGEDGGPATRSEDQPRGRDFDASRYVSRAEYLRDVHALRRKEIKMVVSTVAGLGIGSGNIWFIRFMEMDRSLDWIVNNFAMDQIMAYLLVLVVLLVPGIWIGVAKHKYYAMLYFGGFSAAGVVFMLDTTYFIPGLYVFVVSFFLLWIVYLVFFKIWIAVKRTVARPRDEDLS